MTKRELEQIGIAMGREFYNQCTSQKRFVQDEDRVNSDSKKH